MNVGAPIVITPARRGSGAEAVVGPAPRVDYLELTATLEAGLLYAPPPEVGRVEPLEARLGLDVRQGVAAARRGASVFVSWTEGVALPLAFADRGRTPHVALIHHALRRRTRLYEQATGFLRHIDRIVVLARSQERYLREQAKIPPERVRFIHDKVDHRFWTPLGRPSDGSVVSVGAEGRDYETLMAALQPIGVPTVVVASSLWVEANRRFEVDAPANVSVRSGLSFVALRELYDSAAVVVVPIRAGLQYAAGVNAVLEAMAMGKALIVSATPGIADYVEDGVTARLVPPGHPTRLRDVLVELLSDHQQRAALGARARSVVDAGRNLDGFVHALAGIAREVMRSRPESG
ncbi:MAG: glycosyltransferase family 4 protein [Chloroflexota bacterium]|nr:glycosyltransferase family 4 protein [Chloroflexota bacterium]